jgi:hypothetical protein
MLLVLVACTGVSPDPCAARSIQDCEDEPACALVYGRELTFPDGLDTAAEACYEAAASEPVGCELAGSSCTPDLKFGTSPEGVCYEFGNCVPADFTECPEAEELTECF